MVNIYQLHATGQSKFGELSGIFLQKTIVSKRAFYSPLSAEVYGPEFKCLVTTPAYTGDESYLLDDSVLRIELVKLELYD